MSNRPLGHAKHDGNYYAAKAEKAGHKVEFLSSKAIMVYSKDGKRAARFPSKITDAGTESLVRNFFKSIGILLLLVLAAVLIF